ncbi:MAG: cellulase family glycosylhydrolase [Roseibium sp.]|uniref:cellulase family glycosylhydrolase n=1 Tax=Roseibium sp. TaxID=1936156 RepID=UPI002611A5CA|nr:cellulase family glycosylhydrolase [Roseibium sp.]MCV0428998.1 cellulase family glycosylhydrolase [Roseibium sp.]
MSTFSTESNTLDLDLRSRWGSGLVADLSLSPTQSLNGWTVTFDYPGEIVNIWNARIVSRVGDRYVVEAMGYNANVAAGGTVSFGFQGSGSVHEITPVALVGEPLDTPSDPTPLPVVSVTDVTSSEADGEISFDLQLSEPSTTDITITYQTVSGTATDGSDYTGASTQIVIPAGQTTATITLPLTDDMTQEGTESFTLELLTADGAEIGDGTATGTILDNDTDTPPTDPPVLSISDASVVEGDPDAGSVATGQLIADGPLSTAGNQIIDSNGDAVQIRAVNWFGAENDVRAPHGLWQRPMTEMMDQMVDEGFNAIRLPFSVQNILENQVATSVGGDPSLAGLTTLEIFDRIIDYAEEIGIKIILDAHRVTQGNGAEGIWYSGAYDETDWISAWETLATRYGDSTAVIGADLLNEPHLGTWGTGERNDWAAAAEQAGNAVLDVAPDWLILVEGIGNYDGDNYWWGGQLQGVRDRPVELAVDNKLVYSPHDYPASIYQQPWFTDGSDLYEVFRENWGFIYEEGIAPILLGEFGSRLENAQDLVWAEAITNYLSGDFDGDGVNDLNAGEVGPSFAWWSWNPNSGDTGGYVLDDWTTVRQNAAVLLDPLLDPNSETDDGTGSATTLLIFDVSLDAPATEALSFAYETRDGTAIAGEDYVAASGTVEFTVGQQTAQITVEVIADTVEEADETLTLVITDPDGTEIVATGTIYDDDVEDTGDDGTGGDGTGDDDTGDTGGSGPFVGGGTTYYVGQTSVVTGFDPTTDVLDLGSDSIHNQIPVDTPAGFMMLHMFDSSKSLLLEGVSLADLHPENFAPISDAHLQQDLSAVLAYENGTGLVRDNTVYIRSHEEGLVETVDFNPATDKISFFYLSVRGDGQLNFAVEDTAEGARFYNPLTGQSLTLRDVSFSELDSSHFEWRANQLEDGIAGRMGLDAMIDGFTYVSENVFTGKSVEMAGGVDRAPYHSVQGYEDYTGTPIGGGSDDDGTGDDDTGDDGTGDDGSDDGTGDTGDTGDGDGSDALDAALVVSNDWGSGATVLLEISNVDTFDFNGGWTVEVDLDPSLISGSWNSDWSANADHSGIIVSDVGWNADIAAGQAIDVGFQLNQGGLDEFVLNQDADFRFI